MDTKTTYAIIEKMGWFWRVYKDGEWVGKDFKRYSGAKSYAKTVANRVFVKGLGFLK